MLADPGGGSSLVAALAWVQGTLLGTVATLIAAIAIASIGLMMLAGRLDVRHGARMVFSCFILFGASTIAAGIQAGFMTDWGIAAGDGGGVGAAAGSAVQLRSLCRGVGAGAVAAV